MELRLDPSNLVQPRDLLVSLPPATLELGTPEGEKASNENVVDFSLLDCGTRAVSFPVA